jgi:hypothetical protein
MWPECRKIGSLTLYTHVVPMESNKSEYNLVTSFEAPNYCGGGMKETKENCSPR